MGLFRIQLAAEASGLTENLIRAWERRYQVTKPTRSPGGYRTYTDADIAVLKRLKHLTDEGMAISQAVQLLPQIRKHAARTGTEPPEGTRAQRLAAWRAKILAAGGALDQNAVEQTLEEAAAWLAPAAFYDALVVPVVLEVGARWHAGTMSVAEEHLISQAVRTRMLALLAAAPRRKGPHVVCACLGDEQHELGLLGAALRYRYSGHRVTFLGARTPAVQVARLAEKVKPDLIALSIVVGAEKELKTLAEALPQGMKVIAGGQGAEAHRPLLKKLGFAIATK